MTILIPTLALAFASFCDWLTVRLTNRHAPLAKRPLVAVVLLLFGSAACFRYELFAPRSAPPASAWRERVAIEDTEPLQNVPVVISTEVREAGLAVTVANLGSTTLGYYAYGPSNIQLFQEFEDHAKWNPEGWDWCGTGLSEYKLAPGQEVQLYVEFRDRRRERMLASFTESETNRCGLIVLAAEDGQISFDVGMFMLALGATFAAFYVWLMVRTINRRERWAKWTLAVAICLPSLYVLSMGPAAWLHSRKWLSEDVRTGIEWIYAPITHLVNYPGGPLYETWVSDLLGWYTGLWRR